jgi:hypothetical protein
LYTVQSCHYSNIIKSSFTEPESIGIHIIFVGAEAMYCDAVSCSLDKKGGRRWNL